jgi:hypothetical protein
MPLFVHIIHIKSSQIQYVVSLQTFSFALQRLQEREVATEYFSFINLLV